MLSQKEIFEKGYYFVLTNRGYHGIEPQSSDHPNSSLDE